MIKKYFRCDRTSTSVAEHPQRPLDAVTPEKIEKPKIVESLNIVVSHGSVVLIFNGHLGIKLQSS